VNAGITPTSTVGAVVIIVPSTALWAILITISRTDGADVHPAVDGANVIIVGVPSTAVTRAKTPAALLADITTVDKYRTVNKCILAAFRALASARSTKVILTNFTALIERMNRITVCTVKKQSAETVLAVVQPVHVPALKLA
jgi:hypothetical protein